MTTPGQDNAAMLALTKDMMTQLKTQQEFMLKVIRNEQQGRNQMQPPQLDIFRGERSASKVEAWLHSLQKFGEFRNVLDKNLLTYASTLL